MKRVLSLILAMVLLLCAVPAMADQPQPVEIIPYDELPENFDGQHHYLMLCVDQWNAKVNNLVTNKSFPVAQTVVAASEHPEIGEAIKNGTWGVDEKKATAASATVSAPNRVIKATGDNTAVVMLMGALAIVGVLGLAVRKSDAEA